MTEIQEFTVNLQPGREWHSKAIRVQVGDSIDITCTGTGLFYAGLFDVDAYVEARQQSLLRFPFVLGSARTAFHLVRRGEDSDYYLVLRNSGWATSRVQIRVRLVLS
jgi:hypothetical protein